MRKLVSIFFILIGLIFLSLAAFFVVVKYSLANTNLLSPVLGTSETSIAEYVWHPKVALSKEIDKGPEISARAAIFVETKTGQILYEKNPKERLKIASLTKIMTAIIALENRKMEDLLLVSPMAAAIEPDKMYLSAGEKLTVGELIEGAFIVSANDASEVLAEEVINQAEFTFQGKGTAGRRSAFINLMNSKAKVLGMKDSIFANPTGLDEENGPQYSSAYDVSVMTIYAIKNFPFLTSITSQKDILLPVSEYHKEYELHSGINLVGTYPGVVGFKTGYTEEAGMTLVTVARRGDYEIVGVILNSENRREEARAILDYSFKKLGVLVE